MRALPPNFHSHEHGGVDAPPMVMLRPAYCVLPFLRMPLGYHVVHPYQAFIIAGALIFLPPFLAIFYVGLTGAKLPEYMGHEHMIEFAILYFVLSILRWTWRVIRRSKKVHSSEAGYAWFTWFLPLPVWLCEVILAPGIVALTGYELSLEFAPELGWWLMLCALSLMLMAVWEAKRRASQNRATVDDMIRAETFEARVSDQEAQGRQRAAAGQDSDKPDVAEIGNSRKRTR